MPSNFEPLAIASNPDFIEDMRTSLETRAALAVKWGVGTGTISKYRKKYGGMSAAERSLERPGLARTDTAGETTDITTNDDGTKQFNFIRHRPVTLEDARDLIRSTGDNPDLYNISIKTIAYGGPGDARSSNKISAWPKAGMALVESLSLTELYREAERKKPIRQRVNRGARGTVIVLADWQAGKTGRRGGTPELLQRLNEARAKVYEELIKRAPQRILILDGGDGIEGFESGGNPMGTNDLSLPDQLDFYGTEIFKFVRLAEAHAEVEVAIAPSNHAAWRRGKQNLGRPVDDFGIYVHKQVAKIAQAADMDASWHYPDDYDESLCIDFCGTPIGLVHGNQFGPGKAVDWWTQQAFGDQACARADVLVSAHYHSFGASVAGQNPHTGRERMWLGAPTLDSGSDWYRNIRGRDSLPGTLIFDVTPDGLDLGSLTIL